MDRRSLIRSLFALPALAMTVPVRDVLAPVSKKIDPLPQAYEWYLHQLIYFPIGCDLSFCALRWALDTAEERGLGEVKWLLIGPDNEYIAHQLLGNYQKPYTSSSEVNCLWPGLPYEVVEKIPPGTWKLVFERGVIISEGPG